MSDLEPTDALVERVMAKPAAKPVETAESQSALAEHRLKSLDDQIAHYDAILASLDPTDYDGHYDTRVVIRALQQERASIQAWKQANKPKRERKPK